MDTPNCEVCGESPVEVSTDHVGMCGDCFGRNVTEALQKAGIGHYCARPLFVAGKLAAVCMEAHGAEHAHDEQSQYSYEHCETAMCMWEHVLQQLRSRRARNPWSEYHEAYGMCALRDAVNHHVPTLEAEYAKAVENGYDKAFDWEFVPKYMEDHVTRILT